MLLTNKSKRTYCIHETIGGAGETGETLAIHREKSSEKAKLICS